MSANPWTTDDPQPGDFDDVLASIRIAEQLGKTPHDVVSDLLRDADRSAA